MLVGGSTSLHNNELVQLMNALREKSMLVLTVRQFACCVEEEEDL